MDGHKGITTGNRRNAPDGDMSIGEAYGHPDRGNGLPLLWSN